jgi:hypothetical protein
MAKGSSRGMTPKKLKLIVSAFFLAVLSFLFSYIVSGLPLAKFLEIVSEKFYPGPDRWAPTPGVNLRAELTKALPGQGVIIGAPELQAALRKAIEARHRRLTVAEVEPLVQTTLRAMAEKSGLPVAIAPEVVNRIEGAVQQAIGAAQRPTEPVFANELKNKLIERTSLFIPIILSIFGAVIALLPIFRAVKSPQEEKARQNLSRQIYFVSILATLLVLSISTSGEFFQVKPTSSDGYRISGAFIVYAVEFAIASIYYMIFGYFIITIISLGAAYLAEKFDILAVARRFVPSPFNLLPELLGRMMHEWNMKSIIDNLIKFLANRLTIL